MKQKITLSTDSILLSGMVLIVLLVTLYLAKNLILISIISFLVIIGSILALIYMPMSIGADNTYLYINRSLFSKRIPFKGIETICLYQSDEPGVSIFSSNGWFGNWGWYRNKNLGKYFSYNGSNQNSIYVRTKSGKQYMLGCENPQSIINHVKSKMQ